MGKHAGEDLMLANAGLGMGLPWKAGLVQWQGVTENVSGLRVKGALEVLKQFHSLHPDENGEVDFKIFSDVMRKLAKEGNSEGSGPTSQMSEAKMMKIFELLDKNDSGKISFAEYLASAAVVNGYGKEDRAAGWEMAWDLNAKDETTEATKEQAWRFAQKVIPHVTEKMFNDAWAKIVKSDTGTLNKQGFIEFAETYKDEFKIQPAMYMGNLPLRLDPAKKQQV